VSRHARCMENGSCQDTKKRGKERRELIMSSVGNPDQHGWARRYRGESQGITDRFDKSITRYSTNALVRNLVARRSRLLGLHTNRPIVDEGSPLYVSPTIGPSGKTNSPLATPIFPAPLIR